MPSGRWSPDIADRFHQVASMADGHREFLHGVIEFFQTRTSTHMTIAAEALSGPACWGEPRLDGPGSQRSFRGAGDSDAVAVGQSPPR